MIINTPNDNEISKAKSRNPVTVPLSVEALQDSRYMIEALAAGKLDYQLKDNPDNPLRDSLIILQENMQKLNWVAQSLAQGHEVSQNELMGDFAKSFSSMISSIEEHKQSLERDAHTDSLTGTFNRLCFIQDIDKLWKAGQKFYVTFIDLDNLKYRNDHYGHAEGDRYLRYACNFITLHSQDDDTLYRLGGDEFVLLSMTGPLESLEQRMEAIRTRFTNGQKISADIIDSFSYGSICMDPSGSKAVSALLGEADQKMYKYKAASKAAAKAAYMVTAKPEGNMGFASSNILFEALSHCSKNQYIYLTNMANGLTRWSLGAVQDFGLPGEYVTDINEIWTPRIHPDDREAFIKDITEVMTGKKRFHDIEYRALDARGNYTRCLCRGCMLYDDNANPAIFAGVMTNLGVVDNIDAVTGLPNLIDLIDKLDELRQKTASATLFMVGINDFDNINAAYGYNVGNKLLKAFARKAKSLLNGKGTIFRLDGIRFVLLFEKITKPCLTKLYEQLKKLAAEELTVNKISISTELTGAALKFKRLDFATNTILSELQYTYANTAVKGKKELVLVNESLMGTTEQKLAILDGIKRSIKNECRGFYMVYQPQLNKQQQVVGMQAVLHWHNDLWGYMDPQYHLSKLRNTPHYYDLFLWKLHTSMLEFSTLLDINPQLKLSITVDRKQLERRSFCKDIIRVLQNQNFPVENFCLILDESCTTMNIDSLRPKLNFLRENSISLIGKGFGTNAFGFINLQTLPFNEVVVDKEFIKAIKNNAAYKQVLSSIIECAKAFNIKVDVNCVDSEEVYQLLAPMDINLYQGKYCSAPLSLPKLRHWLNKR